MNILYGRYQKIMSQKDDSKNLVKPHSKSFEARKLPVAEKYKD